MKKFRPYLFVILLLFLSNNVLFGQVSMGINSSNPKATLDITAKQTNDSTAEGAILPRLTGDQIKGKDNQYGIDQTGTIVYATSPVSSASSKTKNINTAAYYLFNGTEWIQLNACGFINSLNCENPTNQGTLTDRMIVSNVSSSIPYTGGNGGVYSQQSVSSTGVTGLTATLNAGRLESRDGTLTYTITGTPNGSGTANFNINVGGKTCIFSRTVNPKQPIVSELKCGSATNTSTLTEGYNSVGGSTYLPYTGGNGAAYPAQTINSTGVTGITLTLAAGTLASGNGTLTYTYSGTPTSSGTATFLMNIGGKTCTYQRTVDSKDPTVSELKCGSATNTSTLTEGYNSIGGSTSLPYTGGNGKDYPAQTINSTGVTGVTLTLAAGTLANGDGTLTYTYSGTPTSSGTATFLMNIGGKTCTYRRTVDPKQPVVSELKCGSATNTSTLTEGYNSVGGYTYLPYTGGNGAAYPAQTINSTGVTGVTLTLAAGTLANGNGTLTYTYSGTPTSSGTATFLMNIGGKTCTYRRTVDRKQPVLTLNCSNTRTTGNLNSGESVSNVSFSIPYTNGNGASYQAQTVTSTGVTGLTAKLSAGSLNNGNGNLVFSVTGNPNRQGTAYFSITIGSSTCTVQVVVGAACTIQCSQLTKTYRVGQYVNETSYANYTCGRGINFGGATIRANGFTVDMPAMRANDGSGTIKMIVKGTPTTTMDVSETLTFGNKTCGYRITVR